MGETLPIDRRIVQLTQEARPRALLLPTASNDNPAYYQAFREVYGSELGCRTDVLNLMHGRVDPEDARSEILSSDLIYVGGGSTRRLMMVLRRTRTDQALREAAREGVVLSGLSAGSICWFSHGTSCVPEESKRLHMGIGLIDAINLVHYKNSTANNAILLEMLRRRRPIVAVEDLCGIEIAEESFKVISADGRSQAYRISGKEGKLTCHALTSAQGTQPISELLPRCRAAPAPP